MKKPDNRNINKVLAITIGACMLISIVLVMQLAPFTSAHSGEHVEDADNHVGDYTNHHNMMRGHHGMMMRCHEMMERLSVEDMDKDGDGMCDFCGMSIEHCEMMMDRGDK